MRNKLWQPLRLIKSSAVLLCLLFVISGCYNPLAKRDRMKRKVERIVRLYALDKDTTESIKIDTVFKNDTVTVPEIRTEFEYIYGYKDTIVHYEDAGITTTLMFVHDTVRVKSIVHKRDTVIQYKDIVKTVIKTVPISLEPEAPKKGCRIPWIGIPCWYVWLPFALMLAFFTGRGALKLYKEWKT